MMTYGTPTTTFFYFVFPTVCYAFKHPIDSSCYTMKIIYIYVHAQIPNVILEYNPFLLY